MLPILIPAIMWIGHKVFGALEPTTASVIASELEKLSGSSNLVSDVLATFKAQGVSISQDKEYQFKLELNSLLGQQQIDKIEAQDESFFDRGWRPAIAWSCWAALTMSIVVEPIVNYICEFFNIHVPAMFVLSPLVMSLITGLCGLYMGARSFEKYNKVN